MKNMLNAETFAKKKKQLPPIKKMFKAKRFEKLKNVACMDVERNDWKNLFYVKKFETTGTKLKKKKKKQKRASKQQV